jgi:signal transduction histidine kinase
VPFHIFWISLTVVFVAKVWQVTQRLAVPVSHAERALVQRQRDLVQDASHELRTPITIALGHAELIQRTASGALREDAVVVVEELTRLRRLSDRLLLLSTAGDPDFLRVEPVAVEDLVLDTVRRWAPIPRRWQLGEVVEATVRGDRERLSMAIDALVENAVKHTGPGDVVEVSSRRSDGMIAIAVADTGDGIPAGKADRLFERFARASRSGSGSGLGLAIVQAIAAAHGGSARAGARPGRGSVFELLLPEDGAPDGASPA